MAEQTKKTTSAVLEKEKHFIKYVFWGLFVVIVVISIIALIKIRHLQEDNIKQKVMYEVKIDSIHTADMLIMSKTFSWAIRGDLLRNNNDQAQLHIENLLKEPHIKKIYVVSNDEKILLSSDKNEIGNPCADFTILNVKETQVHKSENTIRLISPMMELNKKLGISVIEIEAKR